ncbi:polysaccharide biosynthesis tyrosine autokinase [Pseudarthrobacter sp. J64]|uniref:polysaccharide biosynthesis tyrosine autokinase n=1 Tax=Pseudarthrobacter sp. J64 TaxID=3116485 RepID=UPI002E81AD0A|nr:polysaccharide biosynthesis tyrosine autokinase [Pseudarthrobacter sp. J64]MEE2567920.1 polysaccharide biosynthesis tyrosine autokinase [Pseudarthrobacter sp. J64]
MSAENTEPEAPPSGLVLEDYLRIVRSYWKGILAFTLAFTLVALGWASLQPKMYASDSTGIVVAGGSDNLSLSLAGDSLAKSKAKTYKSLAESRLVAEKVIADLGLNVGADALLASISVTAPIDTAEIKVAARSTVPEDAQRIADAWVRSLAAQVNELEAATSTEGAPPVTPAVRVAPLGKAVIPTAPISPNMKLALAIGAGGGLLLGLGYALVRNHLDRRLRTVADIERLIHLPVIGTLPIDRRLAGRSSVLEGGSLKVQGSDAGNNAITEALRELRTNLQFIDVDNPPKIIVVTSSVPSEGKSTVTANLAAAMAAAGEKVVVVDGDLRRPTVVNVFQLIPGVGVTDVLSGHAEIEDVLQPWGVMPNLSVLGSGRIPPNPSELLGSKAMRTMLKTLSENATVLIDAPPLLPVTDAAVLTRLADGAIVVVKSGKTTQDELVRSVGNLNKAKGRVLGTILNCVPTSGSGSYSYYGSYDSVLTENDPRVHAPVESAHSDDFTRLLEPGETAEASTFTPMRSRRHSSQ